MKDAKKLNIALYRLRDPYLAPIEDGISINYVLDKNKRVNSNLLIDCKSELEEILQQHNVIFGADYIDFNRDIDEIFKQYKDIYVNNRGVKYVGQTSYCKSAKQNITLIAYHNCRNVDVVFDDGQQVNGVNISAFLSGSVMHPNMTRSDLAREIASREGSLISKAKEESAMHASQRLHEKTMNNDGYEMEIIEYNNAEDVIVSFALDGATTKTSYSNFKNGAVRHPTMSNAAIAEQRLHEKAVTNEGYEVEIVRYGNSRDIDVRFIADGSLRISISYYAFLNGEIKHPSKLPENRVNKVFVTNQGYEVKVVEYHNCHNVDVQFLIDGAVKTGVKYSELEKGRVRHPTLDPLAEQRLNQTVTNNEGHEMRIVAYRNASDIDVLFVKDNVCRYNVRYSEFQLGAIAHPDTQRKRKSSQKSQ